MIGNFGQSDGETTIKLDLNNYRALILASAVRRYSPQGRQMEDDFLSIPPEQCWSLSWPGARGSSWHSQSSPIGYWIQPLVCLLPIRKLLGDPLFCLPQGIDLRRSNTRHRGHPLVATGDRSRRPLHHPWGPQQKQVGMYNRPPPLPARDKCPGDDDWDLFRQATITRRH